MRSSLVIRRGMMPSRIMFLSLAMSWPDLNSMLLRSAIFDDDVAFLVSKLRSTLTNRHDLCVPGAVPAQKNPSCKTLYAPILSPNETGDLGPPTRLVALEMKFSRGF